ncbi:MAG: MaoC family dehydratase [Actinomycetota bacterium]
MVWPQSLHTVSGPFDQARIDGAAAGMGEHGPATRALIDDGGLSPDLLCGLTLLLLARQPRPEPARNRDSARDGEDGDGVADGDSEGVNKLEDASPIAGGVWVREQFAVHRPLDRFDPFTVEGSATGRFVRKGRRYGVTSSRTRDSAGNHVATNLTCGLLSYRADAGADQVEGQSLDNTPGPVPDTSRAGRNPHLDALAQVRAGDRFGGRPLTLSLAMMAARDTENPDNPIHSDPAAAKAAGLAVPIAGGSHVLSFALEPLLAAWGPESLQHGAHFDIRWRAPTEAGAEIVPAAEVTAATEQMLTVDLTVTLASGPTALVGTVTVPRSA